MCPSSARKNTQIRQLNVPSPEISLPDYNAHNLWSDHNEVRMEKPRELINTSGKCKDAHPDADWKLNSNSGDRKTNTSLNNFLFFPFFFAKKDKKYRISPDFSFKTKWLFIDQHQTLLSPLMHPGIGATPMKPKKPMEMIKIIIIIKQNNLR